MSVEKESIWVISPVLYTSDSITIIHNCMDNNLGVTLIFKDEGKNCYGTEECANCSITIPSEYMTQIKLLL